MENKNIKRVLTIAGSASGGSAGIQADLKTFQEIGVYGMSVITAIVGRHPVTNKNVHPVSVEAIEAQCATAIAHTGIDSLKTGMLFSSSIIHTVSDFLEERQGIHIVVDPVMVGKLDSILLQEEAIQALIEHIIPKASILTPNMKEASILLDNRPILTVEDCRQAAIDLHHEKKKFILVKGGRLEGPAIDILYDGEHLYYIEAPRIPTLNTSGAGCTYSAAITSYLALGDSVFEAVKKAKRFVTHAIHHSISFNENPGPVNQFANRSDESIKLKIFKEEV